MDSHRTGPARPCGLGVRVLTNRVVVWGTSHDRSRRVLQRTEILADATRHLTPTLLGLGPARRALLRDIATRADRLTSTHARHVFEDLVGCSAADDLLGTSESLAPLDPLPCPITIAWSGRDRIFPPADYLPTARTRLPGAYVIELPGVGHVPMIDDPALCARTIDDVVAWATEQ